MSLSQVGSEEATLSADTARAIETTSMNWKALFHVGLLVLMVSTVTVLFVLTQSYDRDTHHRRLLAMQELKRWEASLHEDLLQTRAEFLPHYEGLMEARNALRETYAVLTRGQYSMLGIGPQDLDDLMRAYGALLTEKDEMLSEFQLHNTVLHNSVRYFPSGVKGLVDLVDDKQMKQPLERDAGRLLQSMLLYIQRSTGERQHQVLTDLGVLQQWDDRLLPEEREDLETLVSHTTLIVDSTKVLDSLVPEFLGIPTNNVLDRIGRAYGAYQTEIDRKADFYRIALYLLSVIFVLYIGVVLFRLNKTSQALSKSKEGLEQEVELRTVELSDTNSELQRQMEERQLAQQAEAQARQIAEQASRAKSDFLANMSHEFRTPLNGILGYTQILKRDDSLGEKQQRGVRVIHESGEHLLTLVNDILDLSKIEAQEMDFEPRVFHVAEFLDAIVSLSKVRAEQKGLEFFFVPSRGLPEWVQGDAKRLRQVLLNLLGNAIKFTLKGSVIFRVEMQGMLGDRRQIRFEVEDTGIGIDPEKLDTIFLPFQQVIDKRSPVEGTGLGLSICQRLVNFMGGEIHVASILEKGSRFWILVDLPESDGPEGSMHPHVQSIIGYRGEVRHVLIVDDKAENRSMLTDLLTPIGFVVTEVETGVEALRKVDELRPDIMLVDLVMPEMDGLEIARRVPKSSKEPSMVMIALSANVFESSQRQCLEAGFHDFLPKPVNAIDLFEAIGKFLHIDWVYQRESIEGAVADSSQPNMVFPSSSLLKEFLVIAKQGNIAAIREQIVQLENTGSSYSLFVTELRRFADGFLMKQLCEFLEHALEQKDKHTNGESR